MSRIPLSILLACCAGLAFAAEGAAPAATPADCPKAACEKKDAAACDAKKACEGKDAAACAKPDAAACDAKAVKAEASPKADAAAKKE
ncbi:MAG: hypothetical protein J0M02_03125 [Planctomycetes bacterium]|nr:hypothetical protein [Planctomycetota bacterium]